MPLPPEDNPTGSRPDQHSWWQPPAGSFPRRVLPQRCNLTCAPCLLKNYISNILRIILRQSVNIFPKLKYTLKGFPGGAVVENMPANTGDTGSSPGLGRSHMPRSS